MIRCLPSMLVVATVSILSLEYPSFACAKTYTSQSQAGMIYQLQGEYLGVVEAWGGNWGAQVVAIKENSIEVHLLSGGLPGQGFTGGTPSKQFQTDIEPKSAQATKTLDDYTVVLTSKSLSIRNSVGKELGVLTKIVRESQTLGAKPPSGAIVLFDGEANRFQDGKVNEEKLLDVGCTSRDLFGSHRLHLEFRTPFQPDDSGQKRGNSGAYVQRRYEVQILDSFGLLGKDNECGGIYQASKPKWNMCYPPLTWQTYDIDFTPALFDSAGKKTKNARISVVHNGVSIHENLELPNATPGGSQESVMDGPLFLQNHGNPVSFRNIWVQPK